MTNHTLPVSAPLRFSAKASAVPATGLPDGTPLGPVVDRELAACRRSGTPLVVLSIELAGLESVAQRHGQAVEHQVLQAAWNRIRNHLRASDRAVRVGGAEFGAVLPDAAGLAAAIVDARLSSALSQPYGIGALQIVISARTGVAVYPQTAATGEALVVAATQARVSRRKAT